MEKEFVFKKGSVVVETNKGKVRGYAYNGVSVFKGIPYAKAKRFHAPEPLEAWEGELDATSFGYVRFLRCQSQLVRCLYRIATGLWMRIV